MSQSITVELNPDQRELLLTGLRYVRSSVALAVEDWSEEVEAKRFRQYEQLDDLVALLSGGSRARAASGV